jgi:hypothetical protein
MVRAAPMISEHFELWLLVTIVTLLALGLAFQ